MGFELGGGKRSYLDLLKTPGAIVTILGLIILIISVVVFSSAAPTGADVDAILEAQSQASSGRRIKAMIGMVVGTLTSIGGVLLALMQFSRS